MVGLLANALFADKNLVALDGVSEIPGGWIDHHWKQLYIQFAYVCAAVGYTFVVTAILAKAFDMIPMFRLRASPEEEAAGMDDVQVRCAVFTRRVLCLTSFGQIGEFVTDYVEVRRDYLDWTPVYSGGVTSVKREVPSEGSTTPTTLAAGDRHGQPDMMQRRSDSASTTPRLETLTEISEKPVTEHPVTQ